MSDLDNISDDVLLKPSPNLDDLLKEFETATTPAQPEAEPAGPSAAERLAELKALKARVDTFMTDGRSRDAEVEKILEAQAQESERRQLAEMVGHVRQAHGLEFVDDSLIESAIASGNQSAVVALQNLDNNFRSHAVRNDIERAVLATRNSKTSAPERPTLDVRRAANCSDQEWEQMKRDYFANGGR